ncbi:hypothetical protein CEUSTIGMA_g646.t1 [Chlamydomonas eustigma]|uniref:PAS domain-containing protein n=1 Tax=Chlamydomonas eustigma TaxID=1157962 RepID=A0A250WQV3_9CHLO|nr:hypothetical protein CEUSTIGMA_g646.t1 [Chlamydomonas eustigma]|eukprot:GAX73193.1 hypothetical protein CEUSTIGMA_g646.t1 [Chlamydomonas eustigma]
MTELKRSSSMSSDNSSSSAGSGFSKSSRGSASSITGGGGTGGDKHNDDDNLEQSQSFMTSIFGVLFTLSKEKVDTSARFIVGKYILEFMQLLFLVASPSYGWHIDQSNFIWKVVTYVNFMNPIVNMGYGFYVGILYTVSVLLLISLILCVWVGYCFHLQRFPFVWPIQVLRLFVSVFFMVFYIASLGVFLVAVDCNWLGGAPYHVHAFPEVACMEMPHLINLAISATLALVFIIVTLAMTAADFELNLLSKRWTAASTSDVEVRVTLMRTAATLAFNLLSGSHKLQSLIIAGAFFYSAWSFLRWQPHFNQYMNHSRAGIYGAVSYAALLLLILTFGNSGGSDAFASSITNVMLVGIIPVGLFFMVVSFLRFRYTYSKAITAFRKSNSDANLRGIYRWGDIPAVEMASRVCRTLDAEDDEKQDAASVKLADKILKGGMSFFSSKAEMVLLYANFMVEVSGQQQAGHSQLVAAKNLKPSLVEQFSIFVREQEHMQASQTQASGESSTDLVSYVEFQKNQRLLVRCHRNALLATRDFWRLLTKNDVTFSSLINAFSTIEQSHTRADKAYKTMMERYSSSAKVLRMYAKFLEEVKNDPWLASQYNEESEKMEEAQAAAENMTLMGGEGEEGQRNASNSPVCVINAQGIIQMANKMLLELFGYKRGELDGKNVSMLMPQPFSGRHNTYLRNYISTGKAKILDSSREILGLHKDRYVFPASLFVTKVSGDGMDSVFMGVFKIMQEDKTTVRAYATPGGSILCCDMRFMDWFGIKSSELQGKLFHTLAVEQGQLEQLISLTSETSETDLNEGKVGVYGVHILHRYSQPVECDVVINVGGTEANRILVYNIKRKQSGADLMFASDAKGKIVYSTTGVAEMLSYNHKKLHGMNMQKLIAQPFAQLHSSWMKSPNARVPNGSCRCNSTVVMSDSNGCGIAVKCTLSEREINEKMHHVVILEKSSFEAGVAQQRLRVKLDLQRPGMVLDLHQQAATVGERKYFGNGAERKVAEEAYALASSTGAFGQKQAMYYNRHVSSFIDIFRMAREREGGTISSCTKLLEDMIAIARMKPGLSFRVGVHPPLEEARLSASPPPDGKHFVNENGVDVHAMEAQMLQRETKAAVMRIEVFKLGEGEDAEEEICLDLFSATSCTGIVEINHSGTVVKPACCNMHLSGPLFGVLTRAMNRKSIRKFLKLPPGVSVVESLMAEEDKKGKKGTKGALKNSYQSKQVGSVKILEGAHTDHRPLKVEVECVAKEGPGRMYMLRMKLHKPGFGPTDFPKLINDLLIKYVPESEAAKQAVASNTKAVAGTGYEGGDAEDEDTDEGGEEGGGGEGAGCSHSQDGSGVGDEGPREQLMDLPTSQEDTPDGEGRRSLEDPMGLALLGGGLSGAAVVPRRQKSHLPRGSARASMESARPVVGQGDRKLEEFPVGKVEGGKVRRTSFLIAGDDGEETIKHPAAGSGRMSPPSKPKPKTRKSETFGNLESDSEAESSMGSNAESGSGAVLTSLAAGVADEGNQGDFKKAKRKKRLQAMLNSQKARSVLMRFQVHSISVTLLLLAAHIVCFTGMMVVLSSQKTYNKELDVAGNAVRAMLSVPLWTRVMDSLYLNLTAGSQYPPIYQPSDKAMFVDLLQSDIDTFEAAHHGVYLGFSKLRRLNNVGSPLQTIWESDVIVTETWVDTYQSHEENITTTLWELGNDFIAAGREIMANARLMTDNGTVPLHNDRNWYFIIHNGPTALYNTYLSMIDALEQRSFVQSKLSKNVLLALLIVEACVLVMSALTYLIFLLQRVSIHRSHIYSVFLIVPNSLLRALASKKVAIDGEGDDDDDDDQPTQQNAPPPQIGIASQWRKPSGNLAGTSKVQGVMGSGMPWYSAVLKKVLGVGAQSPLTSAGSKKRLIKSNTDSVLMLLPFILWAILIIVIYPVCYIKLEHIETPIAMVNMANYLSFGVAREVFHVNELCSQTDNSGKLGVMSALSSSLNSLQMDWEAAMFGPASTQRSIYEHLSEATAFTFQGANQQTLLYRTRQCIRGGGTSSEAAFELPCFNSSDIYYEISHQGVAAMMERVIIESTVILNDNLSDINLYSPQLDYLWRVGLYDLSDGLDLLYSLTKSEAEKTLGLVVTLQIILLVLSILLASFFLIFMILPFLSQARKESQRIAELLSQLPVELDVEGMVSHALDATIASDKIEKKVQVANVEDTSKEGGQVQPKGSMADDDDDASSVAESDMLD